MGKPTYEIYTVTEKRNYRMHKRPAMLERGAHNGYIQGACAESTMLAYSDKGLVREKNEDSFAVIPENNEVIVIDGMGGHQRGIEAAGFVAETCASPRNVHMDLMDRLTKAHNKITLFNTAMGGKSGAAVGAIRIKDNAHLNAYHAGDVRVYVFNQQGDLTHITKDRSQVQELIDLGAINDESETTYHNIITSALGVPGPVDINDELVVITPKTQLTKHGRLRRDSHDYVHNILLMPLDRWLIATDGLHEYIDHVVICDAMKERELPVIRTRLMAEAIRVGCPDNITFAIGEYIGNTNR